MRIGGRKGNGTTTFCNTGRKAAHRWMHLRGAYLGRVANLCRQCHSTVHRVKTEMELATHYNTIDRLLECDEAFDLPSGPTNKEDEASLRTIKSQCIYCTSPRRQMPSNARVLPSIPSFHPRHWLDHHFYRVLHWSLVIYCDRIRSAWDIDN